MSRGLLSVKRGFSPFHCNHPVSGSVEGSDPYIWLTIVPSAFRRGLRFTPPLGFPWASGSTLRCLVVGAAFSSEQERLRGIQVQRRRL